jgi:hypothetical protein
MKTKTLVVLCILLGIGFTRIYAQPYPVPKNEKGTGAVNYYNTWPEYYLDVYCEGILADILVAGPTPPTFHMVIFYKNGEPIRTNAKIYGEVYGTISQETFKLSDVDKIEWRDGEYYFVTFHTNFIGNHGTHYLGGFTYNYITGEFTTNKMMCPGNKN